MVTNNERRRQQIRGTKVTYLRQGEAASRNYRKKRGDKGRPFQTRDVNQHPYRELIKEAPTIAIVSQIKAMESQLLYEGRDYMVLKIRYYIGIALHELLARL